LLKAVAQTSLYKRYRMARKRHRRALGRPKIGGNSKTLILLCM